MFIKKNIWIVTMLFSTSLWGQDWKAIAAEQFYPFILKSESVCTVESDTPTSPQEVDFKLPIKEFNFAYIDKGQKKLEITQRSQEDEKFLRNLDASRKTEYFKRVLRSPVPESFKGYYEENNSPRAVLFDFSSK